MTPKEKADQLMIKIYNLDNRAWFDIAKQCALIAVDEIIKSGCTFPSNNTYYGCNEEASEYWLEVKQEIQNL